MAAPPPPHTGHARRLKLSSSSGNVSTASSTKVFPEQWATVSPTAQQVDSARWAPCMRDFRKQGCKMLPDAALNLSALHLRGLALQQTFMLRQFHGSHGCS
jgi:hypothetical protein